MERIKKRHNAIRVTNPWDPYDSYHFCMAMLFFHLHRVALLCMLCNVKPRVLFMKTSIISALLLAPVLVAQEPQSPIVHTTDGPAQVYSETRIFVNGKELTPQEVDRFKKEGVRFIKKQVVKPAPTPPQPAAPIVQEGRRVFINGHELPPEVAAQMIENGIVSELQAPVHKTQPIAPMERPKVDFEPACRLFPAESAARPEKPSRPAVVRPAIVRPAKPVMKNCSCEPKCNCTPAPKKPHCCGKPAPEPATAEKPACGDPNVSMKVYINGKEVKVPVGQQVNITIPAEPDTPVLPTPALDAMPAPAPANPLAKPCEAKAIINGKEVMVPVDARHIKITIGEDGKPVVTPPEEK